LQTRQNPIHAWYFIYGSAMDDQTRRLETIAAELLSGFRAIVVNGPRQAGKSTLLEHLQRSRGTLVDLDDPTLLDRALTDPVGLLADVDRPTAIDEFQRGGDALLLALKRELDRHRDRGQFILAGSTRFLTMQSVADTLTGRIGILELLPFSVGERTGVDEHFVVNAFAGLVADGAELGRRHYADLIAGGGFPELVLGSTSDRFRSQWCESYIDTVTSRANVDQVADIRRSDVLRSLVDQVAARSAHELVVEDLARELATNGDTVRSYLDILATLYLVRLVPAWSTSNTTRAKKRPTLHLIDTALAAHSLNQTSISLAAPDSRWFGPLLESFVVGELAKQITWAAQPTRLLHYRDRDQREVDVILERGRQIVGIEVKATATPLAKHARHLAYLRDRIGDRFECGIVLHTGSHHGSLGDRLVAAPISSLWA
jgi:hypothetical protein